MAQLIGYILTPDQVRREVRKRLNQQRLLPIGRPPTVKDYNRIKVEIITADAGDLE